MNRFILVSLAVGALLALQWVGGLNAAGGDVALFSAPRGTWLGTVRADAPLTVLEERDGWRRVRLEGWVAGPVTGTGPGAAPAVPSEAAPAAAAEDQGARMSRVQGVLAGEDKEGAPAPGAGLIVRLVSDLESLDEERAAVAVGCRTAVEKATALIEELRVDLDRALNSTDNFREAASRHDRARAEIAKAQAIRGERVATCQSTADAIYVRHTVSQTISGDTGRFEFTGVQPGRYRVVATEGRGAAARAWSLECTVEGGETVTLDPSRDASSIDPFWDMR